MDEILNFLPGPSVPRLHFALAYGAIIPFVIATYLLFPFWYCKAGGGFCFPPPCWSLSVLFGITL